MKLFLDQALDKMTPAEVEVALRVAVELLDRWIRAANCDTDDELYNESCDFVDPLKYGSTPR